MKAAAEAHEFDALVVDDLSRLSRDNGELQTLLRRLKFARVRIVAVSDGYDSTSESAKVQAGVRGLIGDIFIDDLRKKVHRGMTGRALKAAPTGGRAYGYRHVPIFDPTGGTDAYGRPLIIDVRREIDPAQANIVRRIFQEYTDGKPPKTIARELTADGIKAPRGKAWSASSIYPNVGKACGILQNELYRGRVTWNRTRWEKDPDTGRRSRFERPASEWVTSEDPKLRIVDEGVWAAVQARRAEVYQASTSIRAALGSKARTGRHPKYLFSGMLMCTCCGAPYSVHSANEYRCSTYMNRGKTACPNSIPVKRDLLERRLLQAIREDLFSPAALERFKETVRRTLAERRNATSGDQQRIEADLARAKTRLANLVAAIEDGIRTPSTLEALAKAESDYDRLTAMLRRDEPPLDDLDKLLPQLTAHYSAMLDRLGQDCVGPEMSKARQAIKLLVGGEIWLVPSGADRDPRGRPILHAHMTGSYVGFVRLAADRVLTKPLKNNNWGNLVAEEGFEPPTQGL